MTKVQDDTMLIERIFKNDDLEIAYISFVESRPEGVKRI
jgi:hypothetical protein